MSRSRMRYLPLVLAVLVALTATAALAQEATLMEQGMAAYEARADASQAKAAVDLFARAAKGDPKSSEARWRGAAASYYYGTYTREEAPDAEKMAIFQAGIDLAKEAVALDAKDVEAHFWLGVLYAVYGEAKGIMKSLALVPDVKKEMQTCIELDPSVEGWGPDRVLGRMYFKLPFFKGGDNKKSMECLERSLKGAPTNALTAYYLAVTYKSEGKKDKARELCKSILTMEPDPRWAPEHPWVKRQAEALLKKLS
jgi:tetratricopeptide (TPR) repeat protein